MPAEPSARVFFALWPSTAVADDLAGLAAELAASCGGRPTRAGTVHLTLAFVGNVAESRLEELAAAARGISLPAFDLRLDRVAGWAHNDIVWAGFTAPPPALGELAGLLRERLIAGNFSVDRRKSAFFPHVTLLRKAQRIPPEKPLAPARDWHCQGFVLVRSQLSAAGSNYRVLASYPFAAGQAHA
ncbi:RNA 2',3'-cyclic phosphodiesterase [Azonexus hydrophilus]|uniref:RNA 2',3'-cyclic phosphodiesterase n=1 Tax=Azonexus hydrophilus TaxID=418702 RepID=UPI001F0AAE4C|nr:RNA 2',3'-cyclic phosphodiesterase [Azonexus hydrophilus]